MPGLVDRPHVSLHAASDTWPWITCTNMPTFPSPSPSYPTPARRYSDRHPATSLTSNPSKRSHPKVQHQPLGLRELGVQSNAQFDGAGSAAALMLTSEV